MDLAKDPNASGSLATSTTPKSRMDEALGIVPIVPPATIALKTPNPFSLTFHLTPTFIPDKALEISDSSLRCQRRFARIDEL